MMSNVLQVIGFVLGILAWVGMIGTCASPEWRKNSNGQTIIDSTLRYDGLWMRCKAFVTGQTQCDSYSAFFIGLPEVLQICRALVITSIGIGFIAILVTIFGLKCVNAGCGGGRVKPRISLIGGLLFGIAAALIGGAVSYYAHGVVQEYYNPIMKDDLPKFLRLEYGYALFIGWASLVVGILGSVLICSASIAMLVKPIPKPQTTHVHELRPVAIVPNTATLDPVPVQVYRATPQSSGRQVRIQQNPMAPSSQNGTQRPRTSSGSSTNKSGNATQNSKDARHPQQQRHNQHHQHHHHHHHGTVPREKFTAPDQNSSARSRRRRSYEDNSRRTRAARGQIKQYV